jgi:carbamoyl-phosphate synthase large subunit
MRRMKRMGFADVQLARLRGETEQAVRQHRWALGVRPAYKMVDTCAGEFPSNTPYLYSCYDEESEAPRTGRKSVVILGSGPNRIGQGVEFDYMCVRAAMALREAGYETIMVNSNPETVSTDYDTSDKLYFEPLTFEHVLEIVEREQPVGVIVQLGGQTPLKLVKPLEAAGVPILGTSPEAIDIAEDRKRFEKLARELGVTQPPNGTATSVDEAVAIANRIGYPVLVRPSYVLGGRAMEIVYDEPTLRDYFVRAVRVSEERPVLVDVPRGCVRGGRRCAVRWRDGGDRRRDAAHRGCGHPLGRLGVRPAARTGSRRSIRTSCGPTPSRSRRRSAWWG